MKVRIVLLIMLFGLQLSSCKNEVQTTTNTLVFNLDEIPEINKESYSSLFKGAGIIILEVTENSLLSNIDKIEFLDNNLYILERRRGLFLFDKSGKFIKMIGDKGAGPGEYIYPSDFTIDRNNKKIYLLDSQTNTIIKYSENGGYEGQTKVIYKKDSNNSSCNRIYYFDNKLYTDLYTPTPAKERFLLAEVNPASGKQTELFLNADQCSKGWNELYFTMQNCFIPTENPKFIRNFMDTIFEINSDGVKPYIVFKSKDFVTKEMLDDMWKHNEGFGQVFNAVENSGKICGFYNYIETDAFIHFKYSTDRAVYTVLHKKKEGITCKTQRMSNDVFYTENAKKVQVAVFTSFDKDRAYSIIRNSKFSSESLIENLKNNGINPDVENIEKLKELNEDSNPLIVYYKFK